MSKKLLFVIASATVFAQSSDRFQARILGANSGESGKCTIEVVVDATAEVEIRGREGRLHTLAGSPSTWRRMDCNMVLPTNPDNFQFSPQDGRGRQALVQEPNGNGGTVIVRIEDSDGGREGYKFDLTWSGSSSNNGTYRSSGRQRNSNTTDSNIAGGNNSIFDAAPANNSPAPAPANNASTWNRRVNFRGNGQGYYRVGRGNQTTLTSGKININNNGRVQITLDASQGNKLSLNGRVLSVNGDRVVADMSGGTINGTMQIDLDTNNQVRELAMTGTGNNRFDLRWQAQ